MGGGGWSWELPYEMVNRVADLESQLRRMREDVNIWDLLSEHRLPYGHERHLRDIITSLQERTSFTEIYEAMGAMDPFYMEGAEQVVPTTLTLVDLANDEWRGRYVQTSCACLAQATELHSLAARATPEVRPLLMADSTRLLWTFMLRSVSHFGSVPSDLGVVVILRNGDASNAVLEVDPLGFLPSLAITLSALEHPSVFTPLIPDLETYKEDRWMVYQQRTDLSLEKTVRVPLDQLVSFDFEPDARSQTMKWVVEDFHSRYMATSDLFRDALLTAAAAEIARREPAAWREVLRGETTELGRHVDRAHEGLRDAVRTVAELLASLEAGEKSAYVATGYHYV
jgi:hypothetical protein